MVHTDKSLLVVLEDRLFDSLSPRLSPLYEPVRLTALDSDTLIDRLAQGEDMVWIGPPDKLPEDMWIGAFSPADTALTIQSAEASPVDFDGMQMHTAKVDAAFIHPQKEFPKHNIDEELRADFLPILEARDRFGRLVGYPGVLMNHYASSSVKKRFNGGQWYVLLFPSPLEALDVDAWADMLDIFLQRHRSGVQTGEVITDYALYMSGERAQAHVKIVNHRCEAAAVQVRFSIRAPHSDIWRDIMTVRRVANGNDETTARCDFRVGDEEGVYSLRVDVLQDIENAPLLAVVGQPTLIDTRFRGFVVVHENIQTPSHVQISDSSFSYDGHDSFLVGTHYYPSSIWIQWPWREFDVAQAAQDFAAMRRAGNRIVRIWVEPYLDEPTLRAMDAAIYLAAQNEITLIACVFNQWGRELGYECASGEHVQFTFRHPHDLNIYSISLRNMEHQKKYLRIMAERWRDAGNLFYNLSNETYIKDPDASQMDEEALAWGGIPEEPSVRRDSLIFRAWANAMTETIRDAGGNQPVFPGYMFSLSEGGDVYLANLDAPIMPWHGYFAPEDIAATTQYFDPVCSHRPLLLEEFGNLGWNNPAQYDAAVHYALAAGASAVVSYEWGVSWLSREAAFEPLPIRDALADPDPRWFAPIIDYARENTSERGAGLAPWPSGFGYGSIYHGTPFPAEAALTLWRIAQFADLFARTTSDETVYVLIPETRLDAIPGAMALLKSLWTEGVAFGVWQETDIDTLPDTARSVLCAGPVKTDTLEILARRKGVQVYASDDTSWRQDTSLSRIRFSPQAHARLIMRHTVAGTLYSLFSEDTLHDASVQTDTQHIRMGLSQYAMALMSAEGVRLVEATGEVTLNGKQFCSISEGRAIITANDSPCLLRADHIRLVVTQPATIQFTRAIREISLYDRYDGDKMAVLKPEGDTTRLDMDSEMARYLVLVSF